jgi:hypothetical protein
MRIFRSGVQAIAGLAALAILGIAGALPAAQAAARSPGAAGAPGLHVTSTVSLGKLGNAFAIQFSEAPDGDVYYGHGSVVYVVRGNHAPVAVMHAAGPVLAVAANSADLFVEVKATVTAYRLSNSRRLRSWSLPSPFPVTMAGLYPVGGTVWAWTDWATDASGFEYANVDRFSPASGTVHRVSAGTAFPSEMGADAAGLYYQGMNLESAKNELIHVTPSGSVRSRTVPDFGAPLALAGGNVELLAFDEATGKTYLDGYSGSALATVFSVQVPGGATGIAGTGAGLLMLAGAKVSVVSTTSGHADATLTVPNAGMLVPGPSAVVITASGGHAHLVRLAYSRSGPAEADHVARSDSDDR